MLKVIHFTDFQRNSFVLQISNRLRAYVRVNIYI